MQIFPIPIFSDNYVWVLNQGRDAAVVDPGDAAPVQSALAARGLNLRAVLITHWHPDHIGGLPDLTAGKKLPVYGPRAEAHRIPLLTQLLDEGDTIEILGMNFAVWSLPGHTLGHIAYIGEDTLLCGDTLFSAGCGRLFEGTAAQMHHSLARLMSLPDSTQIYCTHEYTTANLAFARAVEPGNAELQSHSQNVAQWRAQNQPSLPSTMAQEKKINPFLRVHQPAVRESVSTHAGQNLADELAVFTQLRLWKDNFKA